MGLATLPIVRQLRLVQLRRMRPLADGRQRGTPIVRYYWSRYLRDHRSDIAGYVLEIGTTQTVREYGGGAVVRADAIDLSAHSSEINVVADLAAANGVRSNSYDCFVNQFTMHVVFDVESALYHSIRILKPGGVLLANFACLEYNFPQGLDMDTGGVLYIHWSFTPIQVENLLRRAGLGEGDFEIRIFGNLFARVAYQMNLAAEELTARERDRVDPGYPLLICARIVKPVGWRIRKPRSSVPWLPDLPPARWNPVTGHLPPS